MGFPYLCERAKCALIICCPPFLGVVFDCVKIRCSSPSDSVDVKPIARLTLGSVRFLPFFRRVTTTGVCVSSYTANDLLCVLRDGPIKNHPTNTKNKKKKRESFPGARELQVCAPLRSGLDGKSTTAEKNRLFLVAGAGPGQPWRGTMRCCCCKKKKLAQQLEREAQGRRHFDVNRTLSLSFPFNRSLSLSS